MLSLIYWLHSQTCERQDASSLITLSLISSKHVWAFMSQAPTWQEIRNIAADYIAANQDEFTPFLVNEDGDPMTQGTLCLSIYQCSLLKHVPISLLSSSGHSLSHQISSYIQYIHIHNIYKYNPIDEFDKYVANIRNDGSTGRPVIWGGHVEVVALASALRRPITIISAGKISQTRLITSLIHCHLHPPLPRDTSLHLFFCISHLLTLPLYPLIITSVNILTHSLCYVSDIYSFTQMVRLNLLIQPLLKMLIIQVKACI